MNLEPPKSDTVESRLSGAQKMNGENNNDVWYNMKAK